MQNDRVELCMANAGKHKQYLQDKVIPGMEKYRRGMKNRVPKSYPEEESAGKV